MLIAICGIDGSGKTTQIRLLEEKLSEVSDVYITKQPTDFYRKYDRFRKIVNREANIDENILYELALMAAADKRRHYDEEIRNNMDKIIICDRYVYSGYSYFLARGFKNIEWLKKLNDNLLMPDITFFIDVPPEVALERIIKRDGQSVKKEESDIDFMKAVRDCFLKQPWGKQENYYIINGLQSTSKINAYIFEIVKKRIE